ncbi:MAG: DUF58 domain-containing protein [Acidobacteria bacterium]|nr:DUF58 domain-containing protein [Acidobacteriota bacterium]MBK9706583.1 DUF58 domain-containing protein [Acidobacteriota bacterium]
MVFTRRFIILIALGAAPLLVLWSSFGATNAVKWALVTYDLVLFAAAYFDYRKTEDPAGFEISRHIPARFMIGQENKVEVQVSHSYPRKFSIQIKDEYPPDLELRGERLLIAEPRRSGIRSYAASVGYKLYAFSRGDYSFGDILIRWVSPWGLTVRQVRIPASETVKVYPNINEARRHELSARRNRQQLLGHRRTRMRGQGREFESLRDYVRGDEMRHISWTATARRGRLITRQFQIERNQSIVVMIDSGRLMTSRIDHLSKLDHAINAALAIGYVATSGSDNVGLLVFNRQVVTYLPPKRGHAQLNAMSEALYNVKPQMIEPAYSRAFQYLSQNCKKRSLVIILTDLVDRDASAELLAYTAALMPRHLPLIVTIGDNDLRSLVSREPENVPDVYRQSVAEELLQQREEALARITELGGLALDVPAGELSIQLVNKYLEVKERGLL